MKYTPQPLRPLPPSPTGTPQPAAAPAARPVAGPAPTAPRYAPPPKAPTAPQPSVPSNGYRQQDPNMFPMLCREIARQAPETLQGEARLRHYAEQLSQVPQRDRVAMKRYFEQFIIKMIEKNASDMDVGGPACACRVWYRVDGDKQPHEETGAYNNDELDVLLLGMTDAVQHRIFFEKNSADFSYQLPDDLGMGQRRFRSTMYMDYMHVAICMRQISSEIRPLKSLGFHPAIERGLMFRYVRDGLTLVTGVTGSGKSSTLDAVIDANNNDVHGHIVIIADPIEFIHTPKKCIVRHREIGKDVPSFKSGITQALRQDPDMIIVGEMRDPVTISAALEAADSGHKVFSTLHTSSAVESLDRIVAEYPADEQERVRYRLAETLRCVVSQKLCPRAGGGRVMAKEVLWITPSVQAAIKNKNTGEIYQMIWEGTNQGMITMEQDLVRLCAERQITPETAINFANNKRRIQQLLR